MIKKYVIENEESYPACITTDRILKIKCYVESGDRELNGIETVTGFCFKDPICTDVKVKFNNSKERDFVIIVNNILRSVAAVKLYKENEALRNIEVNEYKIQKIAVPSTVQIIMKDHTSHNVSVTEKEFKDAVLSIVTHEFMHAISVGFADDNTKDDEVYTNLYAKELFKKVLQERNFYDMYMMCPNNSKYIGDMDTAKKEKGKNRNLYFKGMSK